MAERFSGIPGLDAFWEQADADGSAEHPLERELAFRLDVLARYRRQIAEAQANAQDRMEELLIAQQAGEERNVRRLRAAYRRARRKPMS